MDTDNRKFSAINVGAPWRGVGALPLGALGAEEMLGIAYLYNQFGAADAGATPYQIYFETQFGVLIQTLYVSTTETIGGLSVPSLSVVSNGEQSVNGASFTASSVLVDNGDTLRLRHASSLLAATAQTTTATIGGMVGSFVTVTAAAADTRTHWSRRAAIASRRRVA